MVGGLSSGELSHSCDLRGGDVQEHSSVVSLSGAVPFFETEADLDRCHAHCKAADKSESGRISQARPEASSFSSSEAGEVQNSLCDLVEQVSRLKQQARRRPRV